VVFDEFGGPEVLRIADAPVTEPGPGEVRVRIEAFAVNPLDVMMRSGTSPAPVPLPHSRLGIEATGVIDKVGPRTGGIRPGDPVILAAIPDPSKNGSYADHTTVRANTVVPRPSGLDIAEAAAIWVGFSTAYGALIEAAGMRPGDTVLISGASGSVGRAAIQLANHLGAVPLAITRNADRIEELEAAGAASVIVSSRGDLAADVLRETNGAGADIVLDLVRGPGQRDLLRATRPHGKLVAAGFLDARPTPEPLQSTVDVVGYRGFDYLLDPDVLARMNAFMQAAVRLGSLRPELDATLDLDHVADAQRRFESGVRAGKKVVVTT
jgi:NADPH:quinone reductase-like Zn-dependent oxidoreductase